MALSSSILKKPLDIKFDIDFSLLAGTARMLGVDISASSIKVVELSRKGRLPHSYRLERYVIEPMPVDALQDGGINQIEQVSECLRRAVKRMGARQKKIVMALPLTSVITKKINVPAGLREDDLEFQVETEANQYVPFALDEVNLDFQVIGPVPGHPEEVEVLLAAARKDKVEDRVATAVSAGLKVMVMDVEQFTAQAVSARAIRQQLPDDGKDKVIALIDIGASVTRVNVLLNGESVYMRDLSFGGDQLTQEIQNQFNLSPEEAEIAKRNGTLPENYRNDVLQPFCETVALEVSRALQFFFTSTQYIQVDYIFLSGGCAAIPGLEEIISERTKVITQIINPFADMELSGRVAPRQLKMDAPVLLTACGLAMRGFDPS
ncbi:MULTISPECIES: pilus assembly protein PilM [Nitrosomonas]|uniref:Putative type 4 fimbrial biogenesis protein PilM n=1 Tax=Nitrosomonas europaea (strain ATCC 19718 / CIP 103999 / KCTC 2705 / NBRC 14298) TaxID=228410 RepID=Q82SK1_NITEU|nr:MULTISPECIES: pilus assembly protein PilM [Nitrosomonas]CAD86228.1 putative type 4 fimbrial biogenesis protein PilM [Nitrosomonas europaea ATCC 19718]SDW30503.1 type IV pilus assembly protein PilM [Nitrosomonas europaea]SES89457.1 type IV pilus assembly protein PilM [Nitrosomonas europaea]SJZ40070.1 type IV pilus assembly protein PilM [Nitrosomonas europaea]